MRPRRFIHRAGKRRSPISASCRSRSNGSAPSLRAYIVDGQRRDCAVPTVVAGGHAEFIIKRIRATGWLCPPDEVPRNKSQTLGVSQLAMSRPAVEVTAVTNDPHATSMMTTGEVQCCNIDSDVSSKVA